MVDKIGLHVAFCRGTLLFASIRQNIIDAKFEFCLLIALWKNIISLYT